MATEAATRRVVDLRELGAAYARHGLANDPAGFEALEALQRTCHPGEIAAGLTILLLDVWETATGKDAAALVEVLDEYLTRDRSEQGPAGG